VNGGMNKISVSDVLESRPRMSAHQKFFLPNIYYYFVKGEALGLVDGDCPGQLEWELQARALYT